MTGMEDEGKLEGRKSEGRGVKMPRTHSPLSEHCGRPGSWLCAVAGSSSRRIYATAIPPLSEVWC